MKKRCIVSLLLMLGLLIGTTRIVFAEQINEAEVRDSDEEYEGDAEDTAEQQTQITRDALVETNTGTAKQMILNEDNCTCFKNEWNGGINITVTVDSPCDIIVPEQIGDLKIEKFGKITIEGEGAQKVYLDSVKEFQEYNNGTIISGQCETVILPKNITKINCSMFEGSAIKYLELPDSVQEICSSAFEFSEIQNIKIPGNCLSIGSYAFRMSNLQEINLPTGLKTIDDAAFCYCNSVKTVTIPASVETLGDAVFENCASLEEINVDIGNKAYRSIEGILLDAAGTTLVAYPSGKSEAEYSVPAGVTTIAVEAFYENQYIEKVTFPDSLLNIGEFAFYGCEKLADIVMSESVTYIGSYAFYRTKYFEDYVQKTQSPLVYIGKWLVGSDYFYKSEEVLDAVIKEGTERIAEFALKSRKWGTVQFPKSMTKIDKHIAESGKISTEINTVVIPDGVTEIGEDAFAFSDIAYMNIPASVTKICGEYALSDVKHIFCEKGSYAEEYAKKNNIPYSYVTNTVVKGMEGGMLELVYSPETEVIFGANVSVAGLFEKGTSIKVTALDKDSEASKAFVQTIAEMEDMTLKTQMDISTDQLQISGDLHIEIPVSEMYNGTAGYILHYKNGMVESHPTIVADGKAEIDVKGLSPFALVLEQTIVKGDINADGKITMTDLLMCLHHVSGRTLLTGDEFLAADINGDGEVKMTDLLRILHYVSGRNTEL